ncbi:hypothetical protein Vadar_003344 [Vaccinium darrowii]|nr:hypothetical protein Vadar_003344 [Vaccinium darrowii]
MSDGRSYYLSESSGVSRVRSTPGFQRNPSPGMASGDGGRANWKDLELYKLFIDLCLKESTENGKNGGSLKKESWDRVRANPNAKQFRYIGLQYANELKALFDGVRATGRFSWGPSKEGFPADGTPSQSQSQSQSETYINLDTGSLETSSSPNDSAKPDNKRQKKNKSDELDKQLLEALQTLQNSDGLTIEECNRILDEMELFDMSDLLYIVACSIFCESKAHREQWMLLREKPQAVRKGWIQLNGKKLGLL